jgi:hypothetical protein
MDIPSITNAPRLIAIAGQSYFVGRLTPFGHGLLLGHLEELGLPMDLGDDASVAALLGDSARALVIHAALYRHNEGFTFNNARILGNMVTPEEYGKIVGLLFARSKWGKVQIDEAPANGSPRSRGRGWSHAFDKLCRERCWPLESVIHLGYDQIVNALYNGDPPGTGEEVLTYEEMLKRWEADQKADAQPEPVAPEEHGVTDPAILDAIRRLKSAEASRGDANPDLGQSREDQ